MRFEFIAKHRGIWPVSWICEALSVSRSGFHAWLVRAPNARARSDEEFGARVRARFISSYWTHGARRVWHDLLAEGLPGHGYSMQAAAIASALVERENAHLYRKRIRAWLDRFDDPDCAAFEDVDDGRALTEFLTNLVRVGAGLKPSDYRDQRSCFP